MTPTQIISYVADTARSAELYGHLFGLEPSQQDRRSACFQLPGGINVTLLNRRLVEPRATLPGGNELCFEVASEALVRRRRNDWAKLGLHILQEPEHLPIGYTFTASDPDGHRLRVYCPRHDG
ncbi:MAG: VOC family protein [Devosia sp.]